MTAAPDPRNRSLFRHRDFLKLWSAETISQFGTQITLLALPIIAATTLNVTPFEFGLLGTIEFLPFILLSLPAGVWVDRLHETIWIGAIGGCFVFLPVFFSPVRRLRTIPEIEPEDVTEAAAGATVGS